MIETKIVERYADGEAIVTEGIVSTKAYVILSGQVQIKKKVKGKNIIIGTLKEGNIFGEMGLIADTNRTASVIAVGDVNLGVIDKIRFEELIQACPHEIQLVVKALIERLILTTDKLAHLAIQLESVKNTINSLSTKTLK